MTSILAYLAEVVRRQRNSALARTYICDSLDWSVKAGDRVAMAAALVVATRWLTQQGQPVLAARIHVAVSTWRTQGRVSALGGPLRWVVPGLNDYDADLHILRRALGDEGLATAWTDGSRLSLEGAVAEVRAAVCSVPG